MALSRCCSPVRTVQRIAGDLLRLVAAAARSHAQLAAENLFLRKQLALYLERQVKPRRADDATHRFLIHDHDSIYSDSVDRTVAAMGLTVLRTPVRSPQANAFCERLIGTIRRECLDWMILLNERHLRRVLREWVAHFNRGRRHASLGPGIPDGPDIEPVLSGHRIREGHRVVAAPILGGLHHEYRLEPPAA
jgi:putative transposase